MVRGRSPGGGPVAAASVSKCTREEDLDVEEFMREDMRQVNKEEDRL